MNAAADGFSCPVPDSRSPDHITLAHGEGGRLTRRLIRELILPAVGNEFLQTLDDAATLPALEGRLAVTTDSFVVSPLVFPGGDIGSLAVYGTVNDLALSGAKPRWISLALIIEEGLSTDLLRRVLQSIARAARRCHVQVVTGDTKVVPRGTADGLFLNTTGIGEIVPPQPPGPAAIEPGDAILVSGSIGRHGMAVMTSRAGLEFDPPPKSDSAPLTEAVEALRRSGIPLRALRDATRGGVAAVLHEWAATSKTTLVIDEQRVPITPEVRGACEVLGLDPLHVACEGTMVLALPSEAGRRALQVLHGVTVTRDAARIGEVRPRTLAPVIVRRALGREQPLDEPLGAPLPRIC